MKLDQKTAAALELPADKSDAIYFDDALRGFGCRLRRGAAGRVLKTWIVQYRRGGRRTRRALLGSAEVLGAEKARAAAKVLLAKVALGQDPQADKAERRRQDSQTLGALVVEFLAFKRPTIRPPTYVNLALYLRGPYFKPLHGMAVDTITRRDVAARLVVIARKHGTIVASRARGALSGFYAWALGNGLAELNPIVGTLKPKDAEPRDRVLRGAELAAIWRAAGDDTYGRVLKLLMLTGCRRGEVGGMRWSELDLDERGVWSIPGARTKNKRPHVLPLMPMAMEIIASVPRRVTRDHLFGSHSTVGLRHWHAKAELDRRLGDAVAPWHVHDIRRTVATGMADIGVQPHVIEAVLNHQSGHRAGVAGTYNRSSYEREVRAALALWADHVRALVEGGERKVLLLPTAAGGIQGS
jgi:integrase